MVAIARIADAAQIDLSYSSGDANVHLHLMSVFFL